ncbi:hypothetical protein HY572_03935 [Candidatus Micrarchaeota archaeon]|nr:hypothetical protein [Candidatus Micrarchaeota archaeon]
MKALRREFEDLHGWRLVEADRVFRSRKPLVPGQPLDVSFNSGIRLYAPILRFQVPLDAVLRRKRAEALRDRWNLIQRPSLDSADSRARIRYYLDTHRFQRVRDLFNDSRLHRDLRAEVAAPLRTFFGGLLDSGRFDGARFQPYYVLRKLDDASGKPVLELLVSFARMTPQG